MATRAVYRTNARNRRALDPAVPRRLTPAVITTVEATAADTVRLTFNGRVMARSTPAFTAGAAGAETVSSMTQASGTEIDLTFSGDVQGTDMTVTEGDPGIRTPSGGFVPAGAYAIPTFP